MPECAWISEDNYDSRNTNQATLVLTYADHTFLSRNPIQTQLLPTTLQMLHSIMDNQNNSNSNNLRSTNQLPTRLQHKHSMVKKKVVPWKLLRVPAVTTARNNCTTTTEISQSSLFLSTILHMARRFTWLTPEQRRLGGDSQTNQSDELDDSSNDKEKNEANNSDTT